MPIARAASAIACTDPALSDELIEQVLPAATNPTEVAEADRRCKPLLDFIARRSLRRSATAGDGRGPATRRAARHESGNLKSTPQQTGKTRRGCDTEQAQAASKGIESGLVR